MQHLILTGFILLLSSAHAQHLDDAKLIEHADQKLNALIQNNRASEAQAYYADEFVLTTSSGKTKAKRDILLEIASTDLKLEINKTENVSVRVVGSTAVLTGRLHQKGIYKGNLFDTVLLVTDTWVKTDSGWKLLAGHMPAF